MRFLRRRLLRRGAITGLLVAVIGCAPRDPGLAGVDSLVRERIGQGVQWRARSAADPMVDERVRAILAEPLDAEDAVRVALLNDPQLQAALAELGLVRAQLDQAMLPRNPEVEGELRFRPGQDRPALALSATASISDLMFLPMRRGAADAELAAARLRAATAALELAHQTRSDFYDYQAAEQILALTRTMLEAAAATHEIARRLHEAGNITDLTLASERALYEEARLAVADAELAMLERREQLDARMGLWGEHTGWRPAAPLAFPVAEPRPETMDPAALEQHAVARSLPLRALEQGYTAAARRANLARAQGLLPDVRAGVRAEREHATREPWSVGPTVGLEIPLFDRGQERTRAARAEMRRIARLHAAQAIRVRAALRSARNRVIAADRRVRHYREVLLPLAEQILDQTQRQYNAMQVGVFQLIDARRRQLETGRAHVLALRDYWQARAALDHILAGGLVQPAPGTMSTRADPDARSAGTHSNRGGH